MMIEQEQFQALNLLDYLSDLFTVAGKENFSRVEILVILNSVQSDPEIFAPVVVLAQQQVNAGIESEPLPPS